MSGSGAELWELEPLERLAETMLRTPVALKRAVAEAEDELTPRLRRIERAVEDAQSALMRAQAHLDEVRSTSSSGDEDDCDSRRAEHAAEEAVEEARQHLEATERAADEVRGALSRYAAASRDMLRAGEAHFPKALASSASR